MHIALDPETHQLVAVELTTDEVGGFTMVPELLAETEGTIASFTVDGAYEENVYQAIADHQPDGHPIDLVISTPDPLP